MIAATLPGALQAALEARLHGLSRRETAERARLISTTYREGGGSRVINSESDALAYALARMPATYAAVSACLNALLAVDGNLAPQSVIDVGAGPGTASFAAAEAFESLRDFTLLDRNSALRTLAMDLARDDPRLSRMNYPLGEASRGLAGSESADLVVASYVINEMNEAARAELVGLAWSKTSHALILVEPGTPAGYARIMAARAQLLAAGAHLAAPCPHDGPCPLAPPDWCHFAQRLPRSRTHKQLKGAELPFEDEKLSYCIVTRTPVPIRPARVLSQPRLSKVEISARLCTPDGVVVAKVPRRQAESYAAARRWRWGDAVETKA